VTQVDLAPISDADVAETAQFMHRNHNTRITAEEWAGAMNVPWRVDAPHHGFVLRVDGEIVGAYLAYFSDREIDGVVEKFCNLGAWCVLEPYRAQGLRLLMALLRMRDYHFTDLSPSGNVVPLNRKLKFTVLDTTASMRVNLPFASGKGIRITSDDDVIAETLTPDQRRIHADHRAAAAAHHLLVSAGDEHCYVIFRRDTRKRVRAFATVLHVSNAALFQRALGRIGSHLLRHHGIAATLMEDRVVGGRPPGTVAISQTRPKMFKSSTMTAERIDYLYSELVCLAW